MSKLLVQSTPEGIHISRETLDSAGIAPDSMVEVSALPGSREVQRRALAYLCWKLGDALGAGQPTWEDGEWSVPILAPGGGLEIGRLFLASNGEVLQEKAPTHEELLAAHDAARSEAPSA